MAIQNEGYSALIHSKMFSPELVRKNQGPSNDNDVPHHQIAPVEVSSKVGIAKMANKCSIFGGDKSAFTAII